MKSDMSRPAVVKPADELAELAKRITREHEAAERNALSAIEHARRAGEFLLRAKEQCGHGRWLRWLRDNVPFSQQSASNYMRLAAAKLPTVGNLTLRDALEMLSRAKAEDAAGEEVCPSPDAADRPPPRVVEYEVELIGSPVREITVQTYTSAPVKAAADEIDQEEETAPSWYEPLRRATAILKECLAEAESRPTPDPAEWKAIRDLALEIRNHAAEINLRAQRQLGKLLSEDKAQRRKK